jgi:hypothetical protein
VAKADSEEEGVAAAAREAQRKRAARPERVAQTG